MAVFGWCKKVYYKIQNAEKLHTTVSPGEARFQARCWMLDAEQ
jgi:hypothetical protein